MATTLTLRSPEDLLAAAPVVLGFVPSDSVVMFTFDGPTSFHARVDLPEAEGDLGACVDALLLPCVQHDVGRVLFLLYSDDPRPARRMTRSLLEAFGEVGIEVVDVLRADGYRWFPLLRSRPGVPATGVPYDISAHPFAAESVLSGRVTHRSRAELETTVAPQPTAVARVAAEVRALARQRPAPGWFTGRVTGHLDVGSLPDDAEAAQLLTCLADERARDAALALLTRDTAEAHAFLWSDLVRRAPGDLVAPAATVLGFAAWLAGNGALAWCAVDRCLAADPRHRIARDLAGILAGAVPPSRWEELCAQQDPPAQTLAARRPDP